jgi:hypothetical protein
LLGDVIEFHFSFSVLCVDVAPYVKAALCGEKPKLCAFGFEAAGKSDAEPPAEDGAYAEKENGVEDVGPGHGYLSMRKCNI